MVGKAHRVRRRAATPHGVQTWRYRSYLPQLIGLDESWAAEGGEAGGEDPQSSPLRRLSAGTRAGADCVTVSCQWVRVAKVVTAVLHSCPRRKLGNFYDANGDHHRRLHHGRHSHTPPDRQVLRLVGFPKRSKSAPALPPG